MHQDWSALVAGLDVGVAIQDREGRLVYANRKAELLLGLDAHEMLGSSPEDPRWNVISQDGRPVAGEGHPVLRAISTKSHVCDVILGVLQRRTGERMWLLVSALPELDANGEVSQVVVTLTDVSAAQRALRENASIYQSVLRAMSEGVVVHNPDGSIRFGNAAAERTLGLSIEQLSGRSPLDSRWRLIRPDGAPAGPADIPSEITRATGQPCESVLLGVVRDADRAWLRVSTDPIREPGSDANLGVVATFTDVTAERETKLELEASRAQVVRVIDALPGVVFQFFRSDSGQDALPFLGGRVQELFGESAEALRHDPAKLLQHIHSEDLSRFLEDIDSAVRSGATIESEIAVFRATGPTRWLRVHGIPERQQAGVLYTGVLLDVTESHELADALQRTQRREAMADLAAGIAHNFNNMLAVILPNVEMASTTLPHEQRVLLEDAAGAARSAADLVAQMLTLGRQDLSEDDERAVDLVPLLHETIRMCRRTFDRSIAIVDEVSIDAAFVRGRRSQLQQVFLNLCLNARDALAGIRDARLEVRARIEDDTTLVLDIRDNGQGMSAEILERLGEPFFTTKVVGQGTGLGVASAFRTIHLAGGSWTVDSRPRVGTHFTIRLPLTEASVPEQTDEAPASDRAVRGSVLIVDDEAMVRRALSRQVRAAGYLAIEASSGAEALTTLHAVGFGDAGPITAVLLDLSMPGMSGVQVLEHIRKVAATLPVIVLSGHIANVDTLRRATAILQKPVSQAQLVAALQREAES